MKYLDRNILQIQYNLLNLPSEIIFENGHKIFNIYAADGRKLESMYLTQRTLTFDPLEQTIGDVSNISEIHGSHYFGNIEYEYSNLHQRQEPKLLRIHNAEGYYSDNQYYYYRKDHLGNNREVWRAADNKTVQVTHYYPSGMPWATTEAENHPSEQPYKMNGCEFLEDYGLDVTDLGNRETYNTINRFTSMDRFCEKFPWQSPYVVAGNNAVNFVDLQGDSAWNITRQWNDNQIAEYQQFVTTIIQQYTNAGKKFTCEDLALSVLIDFASENGLSVSITNGSGKYDARSDNYTDVETFKNDILKTSGARDMQNNNNTVSVDIANSRSGDMILNRNSANNAGHVQVITSINYYDDTNFVEFVSIAQGNTGIGTIRGIGRIFDTYNPASSFYTGQPIAKGTYLVPSNVYANISTGAVYYNYSITKNIETRRWNFTKF
ncbi:MAG: hypothetical protein LBS50_11145 [Prevotellaceae bacterium]|nr:hypothetical protein [Prevotellaceae bacterium]